MRSDALRFAKERYFNGYSGSRSVQNNFNLITSFIQDSADKHIPSNNNEKFRSFKSKENIHKKEVGPYHGFGY